jgi:excisionase family DNA binding protein
MRKEGTFIMGFKLMTAKDVAEYLQLNEEVVNRHFRSGLLPGIKLGGHWRVRSDVLEKWIAEGK